MNKRIQSGEDIHTEFKTSFGDEVIVTLVTFANGTAIRRTSNMSALVS